MEGKEGEKGEKNGKDENTRKGSRKVKAEIVERKKIKRQDEKERGRRE